MTQQTRTFDLLVMPIEGIAAYWLSLHRLIAGKKTFEDIMREAAYTSDPFTAYLLDTAFSGNFEDEDVARLADVRGRNFLDVLSRRLEMMRVCILDVCGGENPRRTYTRMAALFPVMPVSMENAMSAAQTFLKSATRHSEDAEGADARGKTASGAGASGAENAAATERPDVHHLSEDRELIPALLFYVLLARRHSKMSARAMLKDAGSRYFADGMMLCIDGFDEAFVRRWLKEHKRVLLDDLRRKMELSILMALAVRNRKDYDDAYRIARAFLR